MIPSALNRAAVGDASYQLLRKASLATMNGTKFLYLCHADLAVVVSQDPAFSNLDVVPFKEQLEVVERRRDVLSVLMPFFHGKYDLCRPRYPTFFCTFVCLHSMCIK